MASPIVATIQKMIVARSTLVYLISEEEERVEGLVAQGAERAFGKPAPVYTWSCLHGMLRAGREPIEGTSGAVAALDFFVKKKDAAPLIFRDLHLIMHDNPQLIRQIKDCARLLRNSYKSIFFICPELVLPHDLYPLFKIEDVPLPDYGELEKLFDSCIESHPHRDTLRPSISTDLREKMVRAAMGFTAGEAGEAFRLALLNERQFDSRAIDQVLEEKKTLIRKSGVLDYVSTESGQWEIGGLTNLKQWLRDRDRAFSPDAAKYGLAAPKGILAMGVSGCGKSLCIKAIAAHWKLPLLRLDMGRLYDGIAGVPEQAMRNAIKTAEAVAPCVLWIDEIEAGIANQRQKQEGSAEARVLALFLTWMQEKTSPVFVGATANEVEVLPPELLRKGRFDELFFVGLPSPEERQQILSIHLRRHHLNPADFDLEYLAQSTQGYNGAEIEQGVISAVYSAMAENSQVTEHLLANQLRTVVPLSRTMRERIDKIQSWARDRAKSASLNAFDTGP